jgi:hypothetical protein
MHAGRPRTAGKHSPRSHDVPTPDKISGCGCTTRPTRAGPPHASGGLAFDLAPVLLRLPRRHATGTREGSARKLRSLGCASRQESSFTSVGTAVMVTASGSGPAPVREIPVIVNYRRAPVFSYSSITKGSSPSDGDASRAWDTALRNVPTVSGLAFPWFSQMSSHGSSARQAPAGPLAAR